MKTVNKDEFNLEWNTNMAKPRGKTKEIVQTVVEIEKLISNAVAVIDTSKQYEIRKYLEEAGKKCFEIRNQFDPM